MKTSAVKKFRDRLGRDEPIYGLWVTLESASVTEMAVGLGLDWVVIDAEHGHLDWKEIVEHVRATVRSDTVVLVRIAELQLGLIKRVLDIGADGVVVPWIETPQQLQQAVAYAHYPPEGVRGIGAERATAWGQAIAQHVAEAAEQILVVPIVESVKGGERIDQLCRVPGVDVIFLGPADYSATAGYPGQWQGPGVAEKLLGIKDTVRRHGKHCGVMATNHQDLLDRRRQGFSMLALGLDAGLFLRGLKGALASVGRDRPLSTALEPAPAPAAVTPVPARPPGFEPDRPEVMNHLKDAATVEIAPGVVFRPQIGGHNNARNLTTGIVTFAPGARLPCHNHPFAESVGVLAGQAAMTVEGRRYHLEHLDAVTVPRGTPHEVANLSVTQPAVFHIAMATASPTRTLVERAFRAVDMPLDTDGTPGKERVCRFTRTPGHELSQGALFRDWFNRELGCPEMSGGHALFLPGARLPCHLHDFDESICIVRGTATCVVEGRRYSLTDCGTALVPRGRCHYFINDGTQPMAMIWVYAGPMPERIVLAEGCCS
jgi:2-dehydro-3-deoxyglucarate aldolase/4-hydroxy-2-oxoheptanedioate aldolase